MAGRWRLASALSPKYIIWSWTIHDDTAVRLVQQLDYNFDFSSKDAAMHNGVIARALVLDKLVSTYLAQHPGAVVNITCRASPCFLHIFYNAANPIFSE